MGLETAAIVMGVVAVGATIGKIGYEQDAAHEKQQSIELEMKQNILQTQQKSLNNLDVMEKVLDAQQVALTTRGVSSSSPSFNALQRATLNIGAKKEANNSIEGDLSLKNLSIESENVQNALYASIFGDVANAAITGFNVASNSPKAPRKLPQMDLS